MFENILVKESTLVTVLIISCISTVINIVSYSMSKSPQSQEEKSKQYFSMALRTFFLSFAVFYAAFYFLCAGDEKSLMMEHVKTGGPTF